MGMIIQNSKQYFPVYNDAIVKALPTVDTASGSIATFDTDLTENLIEVKCQIVAQQGGSGTPSPDNVRPIITYNQLNLAHIGNTDKMSWLQGVTSGIYGIVDFGSLTWTKSAGFFYANLPHKKASSASAVINAICSKYSIVSQSVWASNDKSVWDYTTSNEELICVVDSTYNDLTANQFKTAMDGVYLIYELATPTFPTTYTASDFNAMLTSFGIDGSLHNIPFGQTVANGVLDVTTGKLRVTSGFTKLSDMSDWSNSTLSSGVMRGLLPMIDTPSGNIPTTAICDHLQAKAWSPLSASDVGYFAVSTSKYLVVPYGQTTTIEDFLQDWGDFEIVYPLETPQEIQLDSITLQALLNENNIWCDTGDTSVKFLLTVGKKIA